VPADPLPEPGPDLAARNRRLLAERLHWPQGALEECERLDQAHPGWSVVWRPENTVPGFELAAGFYAYPVARNSSRWTQPYACGADGLGWEINQLT
jgi:hypothetical protein